MNFLSKKYYFNVFVDAIKTLRSEINKVHNLCHVVYSNVKYRKAYIYRSMDGVQLGFSSEPKNTQLIIISGLFDSNFVFRLLNVVKVKQIYRDHQSVNFEAVFRT